MIVALLISTSSKKRKKGLFSMRGKKNEVQFSSTTCQEASRFSEHKAPKKF